MRSAASYDVIWGFAIQILTTAVLCTFTIRAVRQIVLDASMIGLYAKLTQEFTFSTTKFGQTENPPGIVFLI